MPITRELISKGWEQKTPDAWELEKGEWRVVFDTSSWMEIGSTKTPRIFDVPVPETRLVTWTVNLIEHLCRCDDVIN